MNDVLAIICLTLGILIFGPLVTLGFIWYMSKLFWLYDRIMG